jgi:peptide/nickel transport system substrate-binding protein
MDRQLWERAEGIRVSRKDFIRASAVSAAAVGASSVLAACGGSSQSKSSAASGGGKPVRGGTLHAGLAGGTSSDTLDAQSAVNTLDFGRLNQLYNCLVEYRADGLLRLALAEEVTPNSNASVWTIRLRPGVTFHNGKSFTADDVIFNFQRITNPKDPRTGAALIPKITSMKAMDTHTVRITLASPFSPFYQMLAGYYFYIVPTGYDPKRPVGTGPFKYQSFTPGVQSIFVRNPSYWETGLPYIDTLIMSDYADETSQVNALLGGQVDAIDQLSAASLGEVQGSGKQTVISNGGAYTPFTMRMDIAPYKDVRVRQALRLVVDRPQLRDQVFRGHGILGNDVFGINDPAYDHSIPQRAQDLEQAKSLLKQAGQENLSIQVVTAPVAQGAVEAAQVFAQQAAGAGVNVSVRQVTSTDLYGSNYLKWPLSQDPWYGIYYLTGVAESQAPTAPLNETHNHIAAYDRLYAEVLRTTDAAKQTELIHEMQMIEYDQGGYILPVFNPNFDGHDSRLAGVVPGRVGLSFGGYDFKNYWLT